MFKVPKQVYTAEFKLAAVQRVKDGQGVAVVARELGISEQTLRNWVKAAVCWGNSHAWFLGECAPVTARTYPTARHANRTSSA